LQRWGSLLSRLAKEGEQGPIEISEDEGVKVETQLTDLTCPDCRGTIWEVRRGNSKDYRCRVGHAHSAKSMLAGHFAAQEKALYAAIVALEEGASLATRLADQFDPDFRERLREETRQHEAQAGTIRQILKNRLSFEMD
jgi:hypothetical protein